MNELYQMCLFVSVLSLVCCCYKERYFQPEQIEPELRVQLNPFNKISFHNEELCFHKEGECIICLEDYDILPLRVLNCFHVFHKKCIDKWLMTSQKLKCPICSYSIL